MDDHLLIYILNTPSQSTTKAMKTNRSPKETAQAHECAESLKQRFTMYLDNESNSVGLQTTPSMLIDAVITKIVVCEKILNDIIAWHFPTTVF